MQTGMVLDHNTEIMI